MHFNSSTIHSANETVRIFAQTVGLHLEPVIAALDSHLNDNIYRIPCRIDMLKFIEAEHTFGRLFAKANII